MFTGRFPPDRCANNNLLICAYYIWFEVKYQAEQHVNNRLLSSTVAVL